jgi:toxin-antitoxin system PIN domain toxin
MLCVDVNVLVDAFRIDAPHHAEVNTWLTQARVGHEVVGIVPHTAASFVRLVTNRRLWSVTTSISDATNFIDALVAAPAVRWIQPGQRHWSIFTDLARDLNLSGNDIPDAYLAATALEAGATLVTADRGFTRFRELRIVNPARDNNPPS